METTTTNAPGNAPDMSEADLLKSLEGVSSDALFGSAGNDIAATPASNNASPGSDGSEHAVATVESQAPKQVAATTQSATEAKPPSAPSADDINRERAEIERQRLELARQREEFEARKAEILPEAQRAKLSADEYDRMASEWATEGKDQLAASARERAAILRKTASEAEASAKAAKLRNEQNAVMREVLTAHPELRDPGSDLHREVEALMRARPVLASYPDGVRDAVEVARLRLETRSTAALRQEVAALKEKLAAREKLLQPGTGAPSASSDTSGDDFDSLPAEKREARILAELRAADSRGVNAWVK